MDPSSGSQLVDQLRPYVNVAWLDTPWERAGLLLVFFLLVAVLVDIIGRGVLVRVAGRTKNLVDDLVVEKSRRPAAATVLLAGIWMALAELGLNTRWLTLSASLLLSIGIVTWAKVAAGLGHTLLKHLSRHHARYSLVDERTLPIYEMAIKIFVVVLTVYFLMLAWSIDVTGWLASAGVLGIAIGFAAQQSLGDLFAGIMIIADAPYKLGDFLVLSAGDRGRVTQIGLRSTRVLTQDGVEIVVPNSVMANSTVVNESGGPFEKERIACPIGVAYGSDVAQVKGILRDIAMTTPGVVHDNDGELAPAVHFRAFGDSSLDFVLLFWILTPETRFGVLDAVNTAIYERFNAVNIEIPYPKRDVYMQPPAD